MQGVCTGINSSLTPVSQQHWEERTKHGKANGDSESTAFNDFASTTEKVCPIFLFSFLLLLFVVGFVCVFRAITSMAEPVKKKKKKKKK